METYKFVENASKSMKNARKFDGGIAIMERSKKERIIGRLHGYKITRFRAAVLHATLDIPRGETRTYKQIAVRIGHPGAYRAVGTALKKNPLPITIPCHRVIKSSGELGNYSGKGGAKKKMQLLEIEGAIKRASKSN